MGEGGRDEEVASKKSTELKTRVQKSIPYMGMDMGIDT